MSYILDALRRAETERQRGAVPSLQPPSWPAATAAASLPRPRTSWRAVALGLGVLGIGAAALWWLRTGDVSEDRSVPPPTTDRPLAPKPMEAPASLATKPWPEPAPAATGTPGPVPPRAIPSRRGPPVPGQPPASIAPPAALPSNTAHSTAAASASSAAPLPPWVSDLPDAVRQQLPPLVITGSVYSENAAQRLLIINGQVLGQGTSPAPGVIIDTIGKDSTVVRWRDRRLRLPH